LGVNPPVEGIITEVSLREEKLTDVNLAVHLVNDAHASDIECFILFSNDSDISPALQIIKNQLHKKVIVIMPISPTALSEKRTTISYRLKQNSTYVITPVKLASIKQATLPRIITSPRTKNPLINPWDIEPIV
jgi:uncharacterized LabA/DUF88 family protein